MYLSAWARVHGFTTDAMDRALYTDRTLVKQLAMRRTLFVVPVDDLAVVQAAASSRVADAETRRLVRDVEGAGLHADGAAWLQAAKAAVVTALSDGRELSSTELRTEIDLLEGAISYGEGKKWGRQVPIGPRVLTVLSAEGRVVRGSNAGSWTVSRPRWSSMPAWIGRELPPLKPAEALADLVRAWLGAFGPGTEQDIKWWLGGTLTATRRALADIGAVEVSLDGGTGYVLPDDLEEDEPVQPWAALLPELDPATMGWHGRDWYLGEHRPHIFDTAGNGGNTAWWDGRIVGTWWQDANGAVELGLIEDVGRDARRELEREADRLTGWLAGTKVAGGYPTPLMKQLVGGRQGAAAT